MLTFLLILASVLSSPAEIPQIVAPEVIVNIAPSSMDSYQLLKRKTPETYTCGVIVRDAVTKTGVLAADLVVGRGASEKVTRKFADYTVDFAVSMKKTSAETQVTVKRGDKVLTRQRSTVYLSPPYGDGIVPLH